MNLKDMQRQNRDHVVKARVLYANSKFNLKILYHHQVEVLNAFVSLKDLILNVMVVYEVNISI
jgi:hypothetical protein